MASSMRLPTRTRLTLKAVMNLPNLISTLKNHRVSSNEEHALYCQSLAMLPAGVMDQTRKVVLSEIAHVAEEQQRIDSALAILENRGISGITDAMAIWCVGDPGEVPCVVTPEMAVCTLH